MPGGRYTKVPVRDGQPTENCCPLIFQNGIVALTDRLEAVMVALTSPHGFAVINECSEQEGGTASSRLVGHRMSGVQRYPCDG